MSERDKSESPSFAAQVRQLRKDRGLSREQLAEASGLAIHIIARIECDRVSPALRTVRRLAKGLGLDSLSALFADR